MGPDITNVASRYSEQYIINAILFGKGKMPAFDLEEKELNQVINYLKQIDESAVYPIKDPTNIFGELKNKGGRWEILP